MKVQWLITLALVVAIATDVTNVDAKKKKKKSKSKLKVKLDDDYDRDYVGCEPWKFTFITFEDAWCQIHTGVKTLSQL